MTELFALLARSVRSHADRTAVRQGGTTVTYAQLDDMTARFAALLRNHGVRAGDRVAVALPNVVHFPVVYYGVLRAGGVVVPMNPLLKSGEMAFVLRDCGARLWWPRPPAPPRPNRQRLGPEQSVWSRTR